MKRTNRELVKILSKIRGDVGTLNPTDQDAIIQIGGALEQFVGEIPPSLSKAIDALVLCLEALQAVYEQIVPNAEQLIQNISALMVAGEQFIASPKNPPCQAMLAQVSDNLRAALQSTSPSTAVNSPYTHLMILLHC
jgi:hypothetical protein